MDGHRKVTFRALGSRLSQKWMHGFLCFEEEKLKCDFLYLFQAWKINTKDIPEWSKLVVRFNVFRWGTDRVPHLNR
jgi:hypothetical protein